MGTAKSHSWPHHEEADTSSDTYWPAASGQSPQMSSNGPTLAQPQLAVSAPASVGAAPVGPSRGQEAHPVQLSTMPVGQMLAIHGASQTTPVPIMYVAASQAPASLDQQWQLQQNQFSPQQQQQQQQQQVGAGGQVTAVQSPETIIIFDWDDTLMCSSAINANQLFPHQAAQLEAVLEQVLSASMLLGETCIVTNADELWVLESTRRFCPRVLPLLSQISVISARRKYERSCPGDVFAWKRETFREVLAARKGAPQVAGSIGSSLNLIVLGDSPAEMEAAQTSTIGAMYPLMIKQVKFKEIPTVDELVEQLQIVAQELGSIVMDDRSSCRNLVARMRAQPTTAQYQTQQQAAYAVTPIVSPTLAYSPPLIAAVAACPVQTCAYYGTQMIYTAGH